MRRSCWEIKIFFPNFFVKSGIYRTTLACNTHTDQVLQHQFLRYDRITAMFPSKVRHNCYIIVISKFYKIISPSGKLKDIFLLVQISSFVCYPINSRPRFIPCKEDELKYYCMLMWKFNICQVKIKIWRIKLRAFVKEQRLA